MFKQALKKIFFSNKKNFNKGLVTLFKSKFIPLVTKAKTMFQHKNRTFTNCDTEKNLKDKKLIVTKEKPFISGFLK